MEVASVLDNLAGCYNNPGKLQEAEVLSKRALAIKEKLLNPNNLGGLYVNQNKYVAAETMYKRALAVSEEVAGCKRSSGCTQP
ncbi:MAG: tetratricopeptide repeat protein [Candidatus Obscuribacterales bacterium]|nr:tetratricopeptide repeat protein [Candidatus Obscuribacterales bacterium]